MQDKIVLITGANSGIGYATTLALAGMGAHLIMLCRNSESGNMARHQIIQETGNTQIDLLECNLLSKDSIFQAADSIRQRYPKLDVLYNNAGANFFERKTTPEGIEYTFMVNYLAPFLLTYLLLNALKKAEAGRIINIAGMYHTKGRIDFENLQGEKAFHPMQLANNAQLAKVLLTYELARRLSSTTITANCFHPGAVRTPLQKKLPWKFRWMAQPMSYFFRTPKKGAETAVYLASSSEVSTISGQFFFNKKPIPSAPHSYDQEVAHKLWQVSCLLIGVENILSV